MEIQHKNCQNCGGIVKFSPQTGSLSCDYCGHQNRIEQPKYSIKTFELKTYETEHFNDQQIDAVTIKCKVCSAETTLGEKLTFKNCPFCGNPLVLEQSRVNRLHKPHYILPFAITDTDALTTFQKWIQDLWFAPTMLKKRKLKKDKFKGIYLPCWSYDCDTASDYKGKRGDKETEWVTDSEGNRTTETHIYWSKRQGRVRHDFKDILVFGSKSIPPNKLDFDGWGLLALQPYHPDFLLGFETETYEWTLREGSLTAKDYMVRAIRNDIKQDIGGDKQIINEVSTEYGEVYFKLLLLPVWISTYRFRGKTYQIVINARTGEVNADRPFSWIKIISVILAISLPMYYFFGIDSQEIQEFLFNIIKNISYYYGRFLSYVTEILPQ